MQRYIDLLRTNKWVSYAMFVGVALVFSFYYANLRLCQDEWESGGVTLETMCAGEARTPFQYRVLVPAVVAFADKHLLPLPGIGSARGLAFFIEMGSVFLFLLAFRYYLGLFLPKVASALLGFVALMVLPFNYVLTPLWDFYLCYDTPSVMFFTIGLILLYKRVWWAYYLLFPLATINRETTCFLTVVYLATSLGRDKLWKIGLHCGAQLAIWLAVKIPLYYLYADNPGGEVGKYYIVSNLTAFVAEPRRLPILLSSLGFCYVPVAIYFPLIKDLFVKRALVVAPLFLLGMVIKANVPEIRIYGEMIPVIVPAFILIAVELLRAAESDRRLTTDD
jgi:hypothetical protein